jgi:hypothetical protein
MKIPFTLPFRKVMFSILMCSFSLFVSAQGGVEEPKQKSDFWNHVQFGGGLALSFGTGYTDIMLAPGAIYNFNQYFALGVGLQGSYVNVKDYDLRGSYESWIYGGSLIGLANPIEQVQFSAELEQVRVNTTYEYPDEPDFKDNFWNTALFLGVGYRTPNVTFGVRYNVLFDRNKSVYAEPFMPFVRVYF